MRARLAVLLLLVPACTGTAPEGAPPLDAAPLASSASPASSSSRAPPRRPTVRHYLARTAQRCEVYSVDRDAVSPAARTPCPQDLLVGERIRVTGKACLREGSVERTRPVVCPGILLSASTPPDAGGGG